MSTAAFDRDEARAREGDPSGVEEQSDSAPVHLRPGDRLGRYELLAQIGHGGMADVWLARKRGGFGFKRLVAIKTIRAEYAHKTSFRRMFLDEARIAASIHHTNVVEVLDLVEEGGLAYQVMAFIEGASLCEVLSSARSGLPAPIVARIGAHVARGLDAAHRAEDDRGRPLGLVHRDVSPHNVLCGADGFAKIADFGIALSPFSMSSNRGVGKRRYMAPEQLSGGEVDARTDVYALGVVMWEALTGARLFDLSGDRPEQAPDPRDRVSSPIPEKLVRTLLRATAADPARRFQTASDFADSIEGALTIATAKSLGALVQELCPRVKSRSAAHRAA